MWHRRERIECTRAGERRESLRVVEAVEQGESLVEELLRLRVACSNDPMVPPELFEERGARERRGHDRVARVAIGGLGLMAARSTTRDQRVPDAAAISHGLTSSEDAEGLLCHMQRGDAALPTSDAALPLNAAFGCNSGHDGVRDWHPQPGFSAAPCSPRARRFVNTSPGDQDKLI
jgi:hypothetical protein